LRIFFDESPLKKKDWGTPQRLSLDEFSRQKGKRDFVTVLLEQSPCLTIAYELKEELREIYETSFTVKMGFRKLKKWLSSGKAGSTIERHAEQICNYFVSHTTSAAMEGINTRIKLILRQSYGFKNFELMRTKLLACLFNKQCLSPNIEESPTEEFNTKQWRRYGFDRPRSKASEPSELCLALALSRCEQHLASKLHNHPVSLIGHNDPSQESLTQIILQLGSIAL
jgi:Transposase